MKENKVKIGLTGNTIPKCKGKFNYYFTEGGPPTDVRYYMEHDFPKLKYTEALKKVRCRRCGKDSQ